MTRERGANLLTSAYSDFAAVDEANGIWPSFGLADRADDDAKSLPYGSRRALEIGVALASGCKAFVPRRADGRSRQRRAHSASRIDQQAKGHLTIVIIQHDMEFLFSLADDISVIHWGQVIAPGAPAALKQNPWVESSNLGRLN